MVPENIRIKFKKTGRLKYISHLDLCRTMCPAMIRAKIPLWYTEGFNPHPKMVFAQPLPLFVESECEFLDIKITEPLSNEELKARLRSAFTDELYVLDVYVPSAKFAEIAYAGYFISCENQLSEADIAEKLASDIFVTKNVKGKEKQLNIRPQIQSVSLCDGGYFAVLDASGSSYLNPDIFCKAIFGQESDCSITRRSWFKSDLSEFC